VQLTQVFQKSSSSLKVTVMLNHTQKPLLSRIAMLLLSPTQVLLLRAILMHQPQ
jgi:hypothetical protein